MAPERAGRDRAWALLLKAIRSLPEREQDEVLRMLLARGLHSVSPAASPGPAHHHLSLDEPFTVVTPGPPFDVVKQMTQPLLIRLPPELHDRLRRWSTAHGFSMAAVARGLIERFLVEREREAK